MAGSAKCLCNEIKDLQEEIDKLNEAHGIASEIGSEITTLQESLTAVSSSLGASIEPQNIEVSTTSIGKFLDTESECINIINTKLTEFILNSTAELMAYTLLDEAFHLAEQEAEAKERTKVKTESGGNRGKGQKDRFPSSRREGGGSNGWSF